MTSDCCQAATQVSVRLADGRPLAFCKHHYERHELTLMADGAKVTDDNRPALQAKEDARR